MNTKEPKIRVFQNVILDKNVYIVIFINQPLDINKAREVLKTYSSSRYVSKPTGLNAVTFIERKENFDRPLLTMEEFDSSKLMLMSMPDENGNLFNETFEDVMKLYNLEKAVMFEVKTE